MKKVLILLLLCVARVEAVAELPRDLECLKQVSGPLTDAQRSLIIDHCLKDGGWKDVADQLVTGIIPNISSGDLTKPNLVERLRLAQVLLWLETGRHEDNAQARIDSKSNGSLIATIPAEQWRAIFRLPELINSLGETVVPLDDLEGVFRVLADLIGKNPKAVADYPALAAAYAVVYDQKLPPSWPPILYNARSRAPLVADNWCDSFAYFIAQAEKKGFAARLRGLRADELKFVVDAPIDPAEFRWALKNVPINPGDVGAAFFMVKYDLTRIAKTAGGERALEWHYPDYTLASIKKNGGVCGDQAYFAWLVGKANGVPTIFLTGRGNEGGHAWVGFLAHKNKWNIDSGRYTEQRYITGTAIDPQTWEKITDHELALISSRMTLSQKYINSSLLLTLAKLLPEKRDQERMQLVADAAKECPDNYRIWQFNEARLHRTPDSKALKEFYLGMAAEFKNTPDIRSYAQRKLVEAYRKMGDNTSADQLEKKLVTRNKNDRADISIATASGMITDKIKSGSKDDAFRLYRKSVQDFKKDAGIVASDMVRPVVIAFSEAGDEDLAVKALAVACRELTPSYFGMIEDMIEGIANDVDVPIKSQHPNQYGGRTLEVDAKAHSKAK
jgi:hypothetical protein